MITTSGQPPASSPKYYLDALESLPEETRSRIETRFIGRITDRERAGFAHRAANISLLGFMPQAEAIRYMEETDYLMVTMTDDISLPGKLFEYLAMGNRSLPFHRRTVKSIGSCRRRAPAGVWIPTIRKCFGTCWPA